jgi:hypothetical protein
MDTPVLLEIDTVFINNEICVDFIILVCRIRLSQVLIELTVKVYTCMSINVGVHLCISIYDCY